MNTSDFTTLESLRKITGQPFRHEMAGDRCVTLDLTSEGSGLIRHHSATDKQEALWLICSLTEVRSLNLQRNRLGQLPETLRDLHQLEWLNLGSNSLGKVPDELRFLTRLRYLHLGNNGLVEIPDFLGGFPQLEYLTLHKNIKLKAIGSLAGLGTLRHLNLHYLNLHRLPSFIYDFKHLVTLTIWNIAQFPDDLGKLTNLEFFSNCGSPSLRRLPAALTKLKKLRMMRLFQNSLEALPEDFGELENLEQVSLYQNQLCRLPDSFARLKKLKKLNLGWNNFKFIPECLSHCDALEWLAVFENPLKHGSSPPSLPSRTTVLRDWSFSTLPTPKLL